MTIDVVLQVLDDAIHVGQEAVIAHELLIAFLADGGQQLDGAILDFLEEVFIDAPEQRDRFVIPTPPQVIGKLLQALQARRQVG